MAIYNTITELIGKTPLVQLNKFAAKRNAKANIIAKVEYFNPGGSVKDRIALAMIEDAERKGLLQPGGTIIEPTSGNTGVGLSLVGAVKGYKVILTMPETMSIERRKLAAAYGTEVVLTPGAQGMKGAIAKAEELRDNTPGAVILQQFENTANPTVHEATTGEEIWAAAAEAGKTVDVFVAGVGTGGTVSGVAAAIKKHNPNAYVVAVEPATSAVISGNAPGAHKIQGIGAGFIPKNLNREIIDEVLPVGNEEALETGRALAREEGLLVGISSGAAAYAASVIAQRPEFAGKNIVALLPDTGERYLSTALFSEV
ncbi:MAG: cysteine synthase A [Bacteroidales bacterium]|nr:cysteine synthase A [Bacteroidales bacterium]